MSATFGCQSVFDVPLLTACVLLVLRERPAATSPPRPGSKSGSPPKQSSGQARRYYG